MSSLVARCPHCDTAFRVVPDQLRVRQGRVRCGVCNAVFDGNAALVQAGHKPVPLRTSDPVAAAPVVAPLQAAAPTGPATSSAPPAPVAPVPARSVWQHATETPIEPSIRGEEPVTLRAERGPVSAPGQPVRAEPGLGRSPAPLPPMSSGRRLPGGSPVKRAEPSLNDLDDDRATSFSAADETADAGWPGPAAFAASRPGTAVPPMLAPTPVFSLGRVLLMLGFWLALLALILQAMWWWRTPLATHIPALRAPLESICQTLGCEVGYVRAPQRLSIVSSAVQPAVLGGSAEVQHLQLQAVLRNRAPHDQPWPHLEVILTDHSDGTVARRVVAPDVYLPDGLWRQPFAAGSDQPINLALAARGNPVSGYRLALFFP